MPLAKIHIVEGRYDETRIAKVSGAIQAALMNTLRVPPEDFYQLIFEFPQKRFLHKPSFVGMRYTDDLIILDLTFIEGRSKKTRLALLKDVNTRVAAAAGVSPDHLMITLYEAPGENSLAGVKRSAPTQSRERELTSQRTLTEPLMGPPIFLIRNRVASHRSRARSMP